MSKFFPSSKNARTLLITVLSFVTLGALIYSNVLTKGAFVMDDHDYLLHNPAIKNLRMMARDLSELRYVGYLSFALDYARAGFNPIPYHAVNFGIHVVNALLAFFLTRRLWSLSGSRRGGNGPSGLGFWLPFAAGLLFLVHPIQTTAASYISQRFTSLAALFYMGACLSYLSFRDFQEEGRRPLLRRVLYVVAMACTALAMKTKESSFTIPVMLLCAEWVFLSRSRFGGRRFVYVVPFVAVALIIPLSIFAEELGLVGRKGHLSWMLMAKKDDLLHLSRYVYFINQLRIVTMYLRLLLLPIGQRAQYDFVATGSLFHPGVLFGGLVLTTFAAFGFYWLSKARAAGRKALALAAASAEATADEPADVEAPARAEDRRGIFSIAAFGVGWFFIAMSVESSVIPIKHIVFEHRIYLPSYGFFLVAASVGALLYLRCKTEKGRKKVLAAAAAAVAALCITTYVRNRIWTDAVLLWTDVVTKSPGMLAGWHNRAVEYRLKGRLDLAMKDMDRAVDHLKRNTHRKGAWPDPDLNPENAAKVRGMRAKVAFGIGDYDKAREDFRATVDLFDVATNKEFVLTVLMDLANSFLDAKLYPDAIDALSLIIPRAPGDANILLTRGRAYLQASFFQDALTDFDRAVSMNPNDASAYFYRSMAYAGQGQAEKAREDMSRACDLGYPAACSQIGRPVPAGAAAASQGMPPGHPGIGGAAGLPPGHPPTGGGGASRLPPGHP